MVIPLLANQDLTPMLMYTLRIMWVAIKDAGVSVGQEEGAEVWRRALALIMTSE